MELTLREVTATPGNMQEAYQYIAAWRVELDGYFKEMRGLKDLPPDEIFMMLAGWTARASEIRTNIVRSENRATASFRTQEIDKFIEECDRQYKSFSRSVAAQTVEASMIGKIT